MRFRQPLYVSVHPVQRVCPARKKGARYEDTVGPELPSLDSPTPPGRRPRCSFPGRSLTYELAFKIQLRFVRRQEPLCSIPTFFQIHDRPAPPAAYHGAPADGKIHAVHGGSRAGFPDLCSSAPRPAEFRDLLGQVHGRGGGDGVGGGGDGVRCKLSPPTISSSLTLILPIGYPVVHACAESLMTLLCLLDLTMTRGQPVIVTVVLKIGSVGLHCDGYMRRIRSKLFKIKGVEQVRMDLPKNQVTLVGTMDTKALPEKLRKKLRRPVDVVPTGKDKDKDKEGKQQQGYSKEGCNKDGKQQGDGKESKEAAEKAIAAELELWKTDYYDSQGLQATQFLLSDENPNACSVTGLVLLIAVVFWGAGVWNRFMRVTETTCGAPVQSAPPVQSTPPTSSSQPGWLSMAVAGLCGDKETRPFRRNGWRAERGEKVAPLGGAKALQVWPEVRPVLWRWRRP